MYDSKLGTSISSMIIDDENKSILSVPLAQVMPRKDQPRKDFKEEEIARLASSIEIHGMMQPIIVSKFEKDKYQIIAGERRYRACKLLDAKTINVILHEGDRNNTLELSIIENIQRENLNPMEEAAAYNELIKKHQYDQAKVAQMVSKSRSYIANMVRLLKLEPKVQQMLIDRKITSGHAKVLLSSDNQIEAANDVIDKQLSVRELEKSIYKYDNKVFFEKSDSNDSKPQRISKNDISIMQSIITEKIGLKSEVIIKNNNAGSINILFNNLGELDKFLSHINK